jgi:hypothetical protein
MSTDAASKLARLINARTGVPVHRFPENIGSSGAEPESRKFCLFEFITLEEGKSRISSCVVLPFPEINDSINVKYDNVEFDVVGAIAVGASAGNVSIDRLSNIAKTGLSSFNAGTFARIASDVVLSGTPGLKAGVAKGTRKIQNPYITNVFNSVGFREYSFSFVLVPKNSNESRIIKKIIETFKDAMLPEKVRTVQTDEMASQSTGILKMPDMVNVSFYPTTDNYNKDNKNKLIKIDKAVVQDFTIDYSAGTQNPTFFKGGAPLTATLTVTVKETEIYTKERCYDDYGSLYGLVWKTFG